MRAIVSTVRPVSNGAQVTVSIADKPIPTPGENEVLIQIEAAPINPSDLGVLLPSMDPTTLRTTIDPTTSLPQLTATILDRAVPLVTPRFNKAFPVGNEGCGVVVAVGQGRNAERLLGKCVATFGGSMYAQYRCVNVSSVIELLPGTTPAEGAACFVNPLTALGILGTARSEGHVGLVHTAAASQLGQMLVRLCNEDNFPLVNIVRRPAQVEFLKQIGAKFVVDSSSSTFRQDLVDALYATGATCAFDATGGGSLASTILWAMESASLRKEGNYSVYGTNVLKQVYIYGFLERVPLTIVQNFGLQWKVGGWLLTYYLEKVGPSEVAELKKRVANGIRTIFKTNFTAEISLEEVLDAEIVKKYAALGTQGKYLINPNKSKSSKM